VISGVRCSGAIGFVRRSRVMCESLADSRALLVWKMRPLEVAFQIDSHAFALARHERSLCDFTQMLLKVRMLD